MESMRVGMADPAGETPGRARRCGTARVFLRGKKLPCDLCLCPKVDGVGSHIAPQEEVSESRAAKVAMRSPGSFWVTAPGFAQMEMNSAWEFMSKHGCPLYIFSPSLSGLPFPPNPLHTLY